MSGAPGGDALADLHLALRDHAVDRRADHGARRDRAWPGRAWRGRRRPRDCPAIVPLRSAPGWRRSSRSRRRGWRCAWAMPAPGHARAAPARRRRRWSREVSSSPETAPDSARLWRRRDRSGPCHRPPARRPSRPARARCRLSRAPTCAASAPPVARGLAELALGLGQIGRGLLDARSAHRRRSSATRMSPLCTICVLATRTVCDRARDQRRDLRGVGADIGIVGRDVARADQEVIAASPASATPTTTDARTVSHLPALFARMVGAAVASSALDSRDWDCRPSGCSWKSSAGLPSTALSAARRSRRRARGPARRRA